MSRVKPLRASFFVALVFGLAVGTVNPASAAAAATHRAAAAAPAATGPILDSGSPDAVAGQYIVVLQASAVTGTTTVADLAQSLTAAYGGTFSQVDDGFQAFTLNATDPIAGAIAGDSRVDYVDQDQWDEADGAPPVQDNPDWGLARINQRVPDLGGDPQYAAGSSAGVTIYVVDSGVQIGNSDFGGRASYAYNALTDTVGSAPDCSAGVGHGTPVAAIAAGTVYGTAKQAAIKSVKVLDCDASGALQKSPGAVTDRGLNWILQNATAPAVVNLSLGGEAVNASRADFVNRLVAKGFTVTMAAGNNNVDACTATPGSKTKSGVPLNAIVAGASGLDKTVTPVTDKKWSLSNFGKCLTLFAPGQSVTSLRANGTPATLNVFGTSYATPYVSGAAAILLAANPALKQDQVKQAILDDATSPATNGVAELVAGAAQTQSPDLLLHVAPPAQNTVTVDGPALSQQVPSGAQAVDFTFTGTAGQAVYVNGTGGAFNAGISLYDPLGTQLGSGSHASYNSGKQETWISPVSLPRTGTYSIHIVPAAGATGSVSVQVLTFATATATVNGSVVSSTVTSALPGRRVAATFAGTAGQTISVNGTGIASASTITLYDPKGTQIASASSFASDAGAVKQWIRATNLSATGTYSLYITPTPGATGTFSLQVLGDTALSATVNGPAVSSTITSALPGRRVVATFAGTAGQTVLVNGTSGAFNSSLSLYDPKGAQIGSGNSYGSDSGAVKSWITPVNLSATGTYTLYFTPAPNATGTVSLQVLNDATATATVNGAAVSSTITAALPGRRIAATFAGTAGQTILVNGTSGAFNSSLTLYDPKGSQIGSGNSYGSDSGTAKTWINPVNVSTTGTYTLYFTPAPGASGTVKLQVLSDATTTATVNGAAVSSTITAALPGRRIAATFAGTAGQTVFINGTSGAFNSSLTLYDPKGSQIANGNSYASDSGSAKTWITPVNLSATGTYTLYFTPAAGGTGTVSMQVLTDATTTATIDGAAVSSTITSALPGRRIAATFSGTAGRRVYVNGSSGAFNSTVTLVDPKGVQIASGSSLSTDLGLPASWISPTTLSATGTYTLYITPSAGATGTVRFQVIGSFVTASTGVNGLPTSVTIPSSTPGKIMAITFSGSAGSAVSMLGITGAVGGTLAVYDPDGQKVAVGLAIPLYPCPDEQPPGTCPQVLIAPFTLPITGTYTVYFTPAAVNTGSVSVWVTGASGTPPTVTTIQASATIDGAIVPVTIPTAAAGNRVAVTFSASAGQTVYINNSSNSMSCSSDTYSLIGPSGQIVVPSYTPSLYLCNLTTVLAPTGLPAAGTYTLYIVPDASQHGTANLQVLSTVPTLSATVDGAIVPVSIPTTAPGQRLAITFSGTAGQAVYINNSSNAMSCSSDTYSLIGPNGQIVVPAYTPSLYLCNLTNVLLATGLPATGTYTFYITPDGAQRGTANLQVLSQYVNASATVDGAIVPVTIPAASPGERAAITFSGTAGQAVYINNSSNSMSCSSDTYSLIGPSGQIVVPAYTPSLYLCNLTNILMATGLPATGTYTFYVVPTGTQHGAASLQVLSQYVNVAATVDGAIAPVTIPAPAPGQRAAITFTGTAGQAVYINNSGNSMSCGSDTYSLVGPNGQIVIPAYTPSLYLCNLTNVLSATGLPATGTYTFYIVPTGTQYGAANLQVLSQYVNVSATVDGAIVPVTIPAASPGERAAITFSGTAGQAVYINNSGNSMSCGSDTYSLVGPNGQIVIPAYTPSLYLCNLTNVLAATGLPATGTYTFYVIPDGTQHGTANLQVLSKDLAVSATVGGAGVPVTIPAASPGQRVAITFAGTAGHAVFITSTNNSMSCSGDTYSLIGPNGQPVVLNYSPSLYLCNATSLLQPTGLPTTGTYTFYVIPDGAQHGTATVQVHKYGP